MAGLLHPRRTGGAFFLSCPRPPFQGLGPPGWAGGGSLFIPWSPIGGCRPRAAVFAITRPIPRELTLRGAVFNAPLGLLSFGSGHLAARPNGVLWARGGGAGVITFPIVGRILGCPGPLLPFVTLLIDSAIRSLRAGPLVRALLAAGTPVRASLLALRASEMLVMVSIMDGTPVGLAGSAPRRWAVGVGPGAGAGPLPAGSAPGGLLRAL